MTYYYCSEKEKNEALLRGAETRLFLLREESKRIQRSIEIVEEEVFYFRKQKILLSEMKEKGGEDENS